jgi:hypothetical protein
MDEWIAQHSTPDTHEEPATPTPARKRAARNTTRKTTPKTTRKTTPKTAAKRTTKSTAKSPTTPPRTKATSTSSSTEKTPSPPSAAGPAPSDVAPDRGAIGSNPERRFSSGASRGLAPKR